MRELSIYVHIPFCARKCNYCDFLSAPCSEGEQKEYVGALCKEMEYKACLYEGKQVDTVFIGGGTPSLLSVEDIRRIVETLRKHYDIKSEAEFTIEVNPGTVNREKLEAYQKLGINRLSIGLQSAHNEELKLLGRIHTWEQFLETWKLVRECGFTNVNIDLMSALPDQSAEAYEATLDKVLALEPEHISAYSLIVEEETPFYEWFGEGSKGEQRLPDEETDREMYRLTKEKLAEYGYERYEISNYAKAGYECKHNLGYWRRKEYVGFGLGAASLVYRPSRSNKDAAMPGERVRSKVTEFRIGNTSDMDRYLKVLSGGSQQEDFFWSDTLGGMSEYDAYRFYVDENSMDNTETDMDTEESGYAETEYTDALSFERELAEQFTKLTAADAKSEFMFLGLRTITGVTETDYQQRFGVSLAVTYERAIKKLTGQGLLQYFPEEGRYALTERGIDVSNQVFAEFL